MFSNTSRASERIKYVVGIDPDLTKSGVGIYDGRNIVLKTMSFWELIEFIDEKSTRVDTLFVFEDINSNNAYHKGSGHGEKVKMTIMRKTGQAQGIAKLIEEYMKKKNVPYVMQKPLKGVLKKWKKDTDLFQKMTGYKGRSNQDNRDAIALAVFGASSYTRIECSINSKSK